MVARGIEMMASSLQAIVGRSGRALFFGSRVQLPSRGDETGVTDMVSAGPPKPLRVGSIPTIPAKIWFQTVSKSSLENSLMVWNQYEQNLCTVPGIFPDWKFCHTEEYRQTGILLSRVLLLVQKAII